MGGNRGTPRAFVAVVNAKDFAQRVDVMISEMRCEREGSPIHVLREDRVDRADWDAGEEDHMVLGGTDNG